jgi:hypothetical protein
MRHVYIIFLFGLLGCNTETQINTTRHFDRYVFAFTYANNSRDNIDSKDMLGTICHQLIYLTKDGYCETLTQNHDSVHFFKGVLKKVYADSLIEIIEDINAKHKNTFSPEPNCISNINIIVESDTNTTYKLVNYYDKKIYALLNAFETKNNLKKVDTLENILKYKYFITNKVSHFVQSYYGLPPYNFKLLQLQDTNDVDIKNKK